MTRGRSAARRNRAFVASLPRGALRNAPVRRFFTWGPCFRAPVLKHSSEASHRGLKRERGRDFPAQTGAAPAKNGSGPVLPADGYRAPPGPTATLAEGASAAP